jgi:hypothetical protein
MDKREVELFKAKMLIVRAEGLLDGCEHGLPFLLSNASSDLACEKLSSLSREVRSLLAQANKIIDKGGTDD